MNNYKTFVYQNILFIILLLGPLYTFSSSKLDSLKILLVKNKVNQEQILVQLCWEYRYLNSDSSIIYGLKALELAKKHNKLDIESIAYHNLAVAYEAKSDFNKSISYNQKSLKLKFKIKDTVGIANSLNNLAGIYDQKGDYIKAVAFYKKAYNIYLSKNLIEDVAMINLNLGIVFKAQKQYNKVLTYYLEAYQIYKKLNKTFEISACEANLGSLHLYLNNNDSCIYYSKLSEQKFQKLKVYKFLPVVQGNIGVAYKKKNNIKASIYYLQKAIKGHKEFNNKKELSFTLAHLAENLQYSQPNIALQFAKEAFINAKDCASLPEMIEAKRLTSSLYKLKKNYKTSLEEFLIYNKLKDSLNKIEKDKELNKYIVEFETQKKELKISKLNQQSKIQNLEIKQKNIYLISSFTFITLGLFSGYLIFNKQKVKQQIRLKEEKILQQDLMVKEVLLAEEKERRRIASDLHDGVGQTLSAALLNLNGLNSSLKLSDFTQNQQLIEKSIWLVEESYKEMRSISHQMTPNALIKYGLISAVQEYINAVNQDNVNISFVTEGLVQKLDENVESVIYRIVQEAISNAIKHAYAKHIHVGILKDEEGIIISIEDDGLGFSINEVKNNSLGIGIKNMQNRIASLKGTLEIDSRPGKGTFLNFQIPQT
jgi:signal transduction histidine kinase